MKGGTSTNASTRSVLVDARTLRASGLGRYLREVLARLLVDPRFGAITLLGRPDDLLAFAEEHHAAGRVRIEAYPYGFYSPAAQMVWAARWRDVAMRSSVVFFPHYDSPVTGFPPGGVVTVHDLNHFKLPEDFPLWKRVAAGWMLNRVVTRAARVLVISEATRLDLVRRIPAAAGKTDVVPNGVPDIFLAPAPEKDGAASAPMEGPFLLCVGNRKPYKNVRTAVEALALLRKDWPDLRLVVVGALFKESDGVAERAAELGISDAVVELTKVEDEDLRALYRTCEAFLFPSLQEGFGLPALEAMASGAPVVASDRSSIPEVVGDAGVLVDPFDAPAMAEAVRRLHRDPAFREDLVTRGHARASSFSWERSAGRTLDVLHSVASGDRPAGTQERPKPRS